MLKQVLPILNFAYLIFGKLLHPNTKGPGSKLLMSCELPVIYYKLLPVNMFGGSHQSYESMNSLT